MYKNTIAIFFSIIILALVATPSIIIALDDTADISMFYSIAEEEETSKIKIQSPQELNNTEQVLPFGNFISIEYFFKKYPKPHLNLISPPPELHIL
jgi:hypothetical protein